MSQRDGLRPVQINFNGDTKKGYFHRFVYMMDGRQSETKALVELDDGKLRYFDPFFVQFMDRKNNLLKTEYDQEEKLRDK